MLNNLDDWLVGAVLQQCDLAPAGLEAPTRPAPQREKKDSPASPVHRVPRHVVGRQDKNIFQGQGSLETVPPPLRVDGSHSAHNAPSSSEHVLVQRCLLTFDRTCRTEC